jgi:hypothetical protein
MRNPFAAVARVIAGFVSPSAEVRAKALPPLMLPHVTVPEMERAKTLAEFWTLHHHPLLQAGRVSA